MPLPVSGVIAWILSLGWDASQEAGAPVVPGPLILEMPDRLLTVTPTPGPGFLLEAAADASTFQARVRGSQNDYADAEGLAYALDSLILGASFPAIVGGYTLIHVHRLGGTPSPLSGGPDLGDRFEMVCTYVCIAGI